MWEFSSRRKNSALGVHLGKNHFSIAHLSFDTTRPQLLSTAIHYFPEDMPLAQQQHFISAQLKNFDTTQHRLIISLPDNELHIQKIELPNHPSAKQIKRLIVTHLNQLKTTLHTDLNFDYEIQKSPLKNSLLLVAIAKNKLANTLLPFKEAGLKPSSIEPASQAKERFFRLLYPALQQQTFGIINIKPPCITWRIMANFQTILSRSEKLTTTIEEKLHAQLILQTQHHLQYYYSLHPQQTITTLFLTGEETRLTTLKLPLTKALGIEIFHIDLTQLNSLATKEVTKPIICPSLLLSIGSGLQSA